MCVCGRWTRLARQQRAAGDLGASTVLCGMGARHSGKTAPVRGPLTACPALVIQPCVIPPISRPMTQLTWCLQEVKSCREKLFTVDSRCFYLFVNVTSIKYIYPTIWRFTQLNSHVVVLCHPWSEVMKSLVWVAGRRSDQGEAVSNLPLPSCPWANHYSLTAPVECVCQPAVFSMSSPSPCSYFDRPFL